MQWLTNGLKSFSNAKLLIAIGIGSLVCLGGMYTAGYLVGSRNEARIQIREVEKRVYVPVKEIQQVQVRNIERERQLQSELERQARTVGDLRRQLTLLPANDCPISNDAVGLLDEAIANGTPADPTGIPAGPATTVTADRLTESYLDAIVQYNEVSTRYNALIDWVEEELIEPQTNNNNSR